MENESLKQEEIIQIVEPSPEIFEKVDSYIAMLRSVLPGVTISLIGSLAIPVCIKNEIDILVVIDETEDIAAVQDKINTECKDIFHVGPIGNGEGFMRSKKKYGVRCELHIIHKGDKRIDKYHELVNKFRSDPDLTREYDVLKRSLNGVSIEKYKAEKNKFLHEHNLY